MNLTPLLEQEVTKVIVKIILGFIVGGIIGLERQFFVVKDSKELGTDQNEEVRPGVRTFGLLSLLGTTSVVFSQDFGNYLLLFSMIGTLIILGIWTAVRAFYFKELGITTSVALAISFIIGTIIGTGQIVQGITLSVFVTFLLSVKERVEDLIKELEYKEIVSALQIGILFLLLFPIIPDISDPFFGTINIRSLFFYLVLILSISFFSYVTVKRLGMRQGLPTFATLGALVNSESVTTNLAKFSVEGTPERSKLIANSILLANLVMILRILFLALVFVQNASHFLIRLGSILGGVLVIGIALVSVRYMGKEENPIEKIELESPLTYKTAFRFVATFALVSFAVVALQHVGRWGYLLAGLVGGFLSNTAVLFSVISSLGSGTIGIQEGIMMIALGTASAITNKLIYAKAGGADRQILLRCAIDIIVLLIVLLFLTFWTMGYLF